MIYLALRLIGKYGHFKKPETNNNPLTYSLIHKPAIMGLMGAILGINRQEMKNLFPVFCDGLKVALSLNKPIIKESHGFTTHKAVPGTKYFEKGRVYREVLRDLDYSLTLALQDLSLKDRFYSFKDRIKNKQSTYPTYFGVSNCPADITYIGEGTLSPEQDVSFTTSSVVSSHHQILTDDLDLCIEKIPTFQTNDWYNPRDRFISVAFPTSCGPIQVSGKHNQKDNGECLWFF